MHLAHKAHLLTFYLTLSLGAYAQTASPVLVGDPAHPAATKNWLDTKLYFGLGPVNAPHKGIAEAKWRSFLDKEVTSRFPDGLSVVDVYGQWMSKRDQSIAGARPEHIRSKLVVIEYPATAENAERIEAIRVAWKQLTGDQSVLKVTQPADVSF